MLAGLFILCGIASANGEQAPANPSDSQAPELEKVTEPIGAHVLIAYFSRTGNTETIANMIASTTKGDLHRIETFIPYPDDYEECKDAATEEKTSGARPGLSSHLENMDQYDVIFLGYPIWWSTMPMAMFTFLEEHDFSGKTIVPFCTHEGSGLGGSVGDIASLCPNATIAEGFAARGSRTDKAQSDVVEWIDRLDILGQD